MQPEDIWEQAAQEIRAWIQLQIKAQKQCPVMNPKEGWREHCNIISQLGVLLSKFRKKAGHDPKEIFKELKTLPTHSDWSDKK